MRTYRWLIPALLLANIALGAGIYLKFSPDNTAYAQLGGRRADFITVTGRLNNNSILYVLDDSSGKLGAFKIDTNAKQILPVSGTDVAQDMARAFPGGK